MGKLKYVRTKALPGYLLLSDILWRMGVKECSSVATSVSDSEEVITHCYVSPKTGGKIVAIEYIKTVHGTDSLSTVTFYEVCNGKD